jgi:serine protease
MFRFSITLLVGCIASSALLAQTYREVLIDMQTTGRTRAQVEASFTAQVGPAKKTNLIAGRFLTMTWPQSRDFTPLASELAKSGRTLSWQGFNAPMKAQAVATPNDFLWTVQWNMNDKDTGINLLSAWEITQGNSTPVAVIDTGVIKHIDFAGKVLPGYDTISNLAVANDGDGPDANATDPGDFIEPGDCANANSPGATAFRPSSWHGTAVAGIIAAAANNTDGMAGISQGARILPIRVLGKCGGTVSDVLAGVAWAAGIEMDTTFPKNPNPSRILNLSLGGERTCAGAEAEFYKMVVQKQIVVVASAGNDNSALDRSPASCPGVIAVGSHNSTGNRSTFSNFSSRVNLSAPGGDLTSNTNLKIPTTYNSGTRAPIEDSYQGLQGTSFSAPHVAGVVHLILSKNPELTVGQVSWILERSARPFLANSNCANLKNCGAGMLDARRALDATPPVGAKSTAAAAQLTAVEYYFAPEDRYFLSTDAGEQAAIDAGQAGAFVRTGLQFKAFSTEGVAPANTTTVCRFYGRPDAPGPNSHFFTADGGECTGLVDGQALNASSVARWNFEGQAFQIYRASNGTCAAGQKPVYRAYNNGFAKGKASNHRFVADEAVYQGMAAKGWALEGIAMCSIG